jgi:hypothetical protein
MHECTKDALKGLLPEAAQVLAGTSSLVMLHGLDQQSHTLAKAVTKRLTQTPAYEQLLPVHGIGTILAQPMVLETGEMGRLPTGGP